MEKQTELLLNNPYQYFAYYQLFERFVNKPKFLTNVKSRLEATHLLYFRDTPGHFLCLSDHENTRCNCPPKGFQVGFKSDQT